MVAREWPTLRAEEQGAVCTVRLTRERINVQMLRDLEEVGAYLADDSPASVVVFRGSNGVFSRGIDLGDFSARKPPDIHGFHKWERALVTLERLPKVTVAVVDGACCGGGVQLALACDFRLATAPSWFALDEVKRGFLPGMATWRLAKFVGMGTARWLVLSGQSVDAAAALGMGLIDRTCPADALEAALAAAVMEFLPVNGKVVSLARRLLNESYGAEHEAFLGGFLAAQQVAITAEPFVRVLQSAWMPPGE